MDTTRDHLETTAGQTVHEKPTENEETKLRHVAGTFPRGVWLVAMIVVMERFVYFGLTTPLQNYMQNHRDNKLRPGALGLGQSKATSLWYFFAFLTFVSPPAGAVVADVWLGRYKTLLWSTSAYCTGALILFVTSLPVSLENGAGFGGLITAMIFIGVASGSFKSCITAFIGEQYTETKPKMRTLKSGEKVIEDPKVTIQSIYNLYFWCVNAGTISVVPATILEKQIGFWAAFLLPLVAICLGLLLLFVGSNYFITRAPDGTILSKAFRALKYGALGGFNMNKARPNVLEASGKEVPWDDKFIDDIKSALVACRVFLPFPILCLCQAQISSNLISMAGSMETHGFPNDLMLLFNPVSILLLLPLVDRALYPFLRRQGMEMKPVSRMTFGFLMETIAMGYAAIVQRLIYTKKPCYEFPRSCSASMDGTLPNRISVFLQVPIYFTEGFGEVFCTAAGYEYAYTKANASMKSLVQALFIFTAVISTLLGWALTPLYHDPRLVIMYALLSGLMGGAMVLAFIFLKKYDRKDHEVRDATENAVSGDK